MGEEVLAVAERQLGVPYSWGGGDRLGPSPGFCSDGNGYLNDVCSGEDTDGFDRSGLTLYCRYQAPPARWAWLTTPAPSSTREPRSPETT